jgi:POT family proton-dependent oligopeptide transporter
MSSRSGSSSVPRRWSRPLALLCLVQSCERFAFLAMLPMFVLYAHDRLAMSAPTALMVLAVLQALSYLGGLPGGWLADRRLGVRASTVLGALLLTVAYAALALDRAWLIWPALALMVVGHSLFRPGLHVLIACATGNDERARERGFLWHYLAANLGYAVGALFGEWARAARGWSVLFGGAAIASLLGAGLLLLGKQWLRGHREDAEEMGKTSGTDPRRGNMAAVWMLCSVAVVFWLTAQQAGSSLTVFAAMNTAQQITLLWHTMQLGPGHFAALHGLMVIAMLPVFLHLHARKQVRTSSMTNTLIWGYVATAAAFMLMAAASLRGGDVGRVSGAWLLGCYVLLSLAEILLAPLGVSLVTRLAPQHKATQAVGLWFAGSAFGNGLAALLGLCWDLWPHHRYFAALAAVSLAAAVPLLSRRRHLDWLTALTVSTASQSAVQKRAQTMNPASIPNLDPIVPTIAVAAAAQTPSWSRLLLVALPIVLPGSLMVNTTLPLLVRGVSAIVCGLAVLLCGPYLFSHTLAHWAGREVR